MGFKFGAMRFNFGRFIDIIYFLALELESREALEKITNVTKNLRKTINQDEKSEYNEKDVITDNCNNKLIGV